MLTIVEQEKEWYNFCRISERGFAMKKVLSFLLSAVIMLSMTVNCYAALFGDVTADGQTDILDVLRLAKYVAGWDVECNEEIADTNGDGNVNIMDVLRLAKYVAGWDLDSVEDSPTAWEIADMMNLGNNLGNTYEGHYTDGTLNYTWVNTIGSNTPADYEACWGGGHPTKLTVQGMKDCGFDTIRIPVYWGNMMKNDGTWTVHPDYLARVREIIDHASEAGMIAVVNIHHFDEFIIKRYSNQECYDIFYRIWSQIAQAYKDCPYTVIFEGFNEYLGGARFNAEGELVDRSKSEAYENAYMCNQAFVDAVRDTGGNNAERVLIASGYYTNIDNTTSSQFKMPTDTVEDRLMISVHYVDNNMYWSNQIGTQNWMDYIDDQCDKLEKAFISKGIPVFMGETTASYPADRISSNAKHKTSPECLEYVLNKLTERGIVPVLWTTGSDYYDRETGRMADTAHGRIIEKIAEELR